MAGGRLPQQLQHWPGFWARTGRWAHYHPHWFVSVHLHRIPAAVSSRRNRLHLTKTVDSWSPIYYIGVHGWLLTHSTLVMVRIYCTREYLRPFTSSDEASWRWPTLIAVFHHAPAARRGRVRSYQLSAFGFQIVAVFGRIRIVHLAHYSVRFEFESNIRYSPKY